MVFPSKTFISPPWWKNLSLFFVLTGAGLIANYLRYPIFFNLDFLFGSIFAMLALQVLGIGLGVLSAFFISTITYSLWNHPYAVVIMTLEALVVGLLVRRNRFGFVFADTLYWFLIGAPLVYLFYHLVMHLPLDNTWVTMTKQAVNGIANALLARLVFIGLSYHPKKTFFPFRK